MKLERLKQNIDYDKIIRGEHLDRETYDRKFRMWDYIEKHDLLAKKDPKALLLLYDPTIYAYAFLKDDKGERLVLTAYQDAILNCEHDFTEHNPNRCVIFKASNQIGKSYALGVLAICKAMQEENVNIIIVSKSLPQSQFVLATIRYILNTSKFADTWKEDVGETANTTILTFERNEGKILNRIICAPCGEGLLGYPVHYLFLDEIDFYENADMFFYKIAYPRLLKTKGQIIVFSNPNAEISSNASILWSLWGGKSRDLFQRKFTFNYLDAPWNTKERYEADRKTYPSYIFASTHNGDFPPDSGGFFTTKEIEDMMQKEWKNQLPIVDRPIFIGLDLAKMRDRTVLSLGILRKNKDDPTLSDLEILYFKGFKLKTDYDVILKELKRIVDIYKINHHGVGAIGIDTSGVGRAVSDFALSQGIKVVDVKFSLENKSQMYAKFKMLAEQRRIRVIYNEDCERQLSSLVFKRTPAGYLSVHHAKESDMDDYPDSMCALIDVTIMPGRIPVTLVNVDKKPQGEKDKMTTRQLAEKKSVLENRPKIYGVSNELDELRRWMS